MFKLDMRTALFSYLLISVMSTLLVALVIKQFSNRYKGVYHLFFCFLLQAIAILLILLRDIVPDWMSFDMSNSLSIAGIIFFLVGIENYAGRKSSLKPNLLLLLIFAAVHTWFTFVSPDLSVRHLNVSAAWLIIFLQSSIMMLFRLPGSGVRRILPMTLISIAFCIVCIMRIVKFFLWGHSADYFQSDLFDIIVIIICQVLLVLLMFSLAYMFGGRLFDDIKAEEEKFSRIFHTSPYAILLSRLSDGKILEVNRVFLEKTGYQNSDVIGKTTLEISIWADYEDRLSLLSSLEKHEKVTGKEIMIRTRTGDLITGLLTSELIAINNEICIFSSFEDISERKLIEKEKEELFRSLVESEEKCRSFFMNSLDANFLTSPDGRIFSANPAACAMLGYTEQEICSLGRNKLADINDPRLSEGLAERDATGKFSGEITMIRKNGEKFPVELSSVVFCNREGKKMTSMIVKDITERKLAETRLRKSKELLENLNWHLMDVRENERKKIAIALHDDLGQRLTGLCLDLAWLKKKLIGQPAAVYEKIDQASSTVMETIENVKETSSFLRPAILSELGLIPAIESHLRKSGDRSGIRFNFSYNTHHATFDEGISLVLYRIVQESVTNIIRHSQATDVMVLLRKSDDGLFLSISDNGTGIDEDQITSLSSMGIAGMKERIKVVHGRLAISGVPGKGTVVSVTIPIKNAEI